MLLWVCIGCQTSTVYEHNYCLCRSRWASCCEEDGIGLCSHRIGSPRRLTDWRGIDYKEQWQLSDGAAVCGDHIARGRFVLHCCEVFEVRLEVGEDMTAIRVHIHLHMKATKYEELFLNSVPSSMDLRLALVAVACACQANTSNLDLTTALHGRLESLTRSLGPAKLGAIKAS